jgi:transcriptional regulator with XRE-family HTH domain
MRQRHNARQAFYSASDIALFLLAYQNFGMANAKRTRFKRDKIHLRGWRKFRGLTQEQVAERTGIDQSTVGRIETGNLPYNEETLGRFAFAYGVDIADLFTDPMKPDAPKLAYDRLRAAPKEIQDRALAVIDALLKAG